MNRRTFLKPLGEVPALPGFASLVQDVRAVAKRPMRRVRPSDAAWPSPARWRRAFLSKASGLP